MSKVYRYVLQHKESEVVNLDEELSFIQHYIQLLHIRYADGLKITTTVSDEAKDKGIVMVTLQMLIDNAVKHNILQQDEPLRIEIFDDADFLVVRNNKQLRKQIETSNGQGIQQLKQLYAFLTQKQIVIEDTDDNSVSYTHLDVYKRQLQYHEHEYHQQDERYCHPESYGFSRQ